MLFSIIFLLLLSCNSCVGNLYGTNERQYLNIIINNSKFDSGFLTKYIDSVYYKKHPVPDSIKYEFSSDKKFESQERLIYFDNQPEEAYLVGFNASPCWIIYIYNPAMSSGLIGSGEKLSDFEKKRIESRFYNQVLKQAEIYVKENHIPDSVAYVK